MAIMQKKPEESGQPAGAIELRWLGHGTFELMSPGGTKLLIDPFITGNPATPAAFKDLSRYGRADKPAAILVTHAHSDHASDTKAVASVSGAPVIGIVEYVSSLGLPAAQSKGGNVGGAFKVGDVTVRLVPAVHSSEVGRALGFVLQFEDGRTLYDTGDTFIFGDMALIEELYHPNIILLTVGGGPYTQDPRTAALAIEKYFHPKFIVPMHYGTFPVLATEADVRGVFAGDSRVKFLQPGDDTIFMELRSKDRAAAK
jgi:L-ascorbate metabolism protein UlaG (beta-lactamase superfamily)